MRLTLAIAAALAAPIFAQTPAQIRAELGAGVQAPTTGQNNPTAVPAVTSLFGEPCATPCGALNDTGGTQRTGTLPNEYGYAFQPSSAVTVVGISFQTSNTTLAPVETMSCAVYREDSTTAGQPAAASIATGTMGVRSGYGWYHAVFDMPVSVAANETIWISQLDTNNILASAKTARAGARRRRPAPSGAAPAPPGRAPASSTSRSTASSVTTRPSPPRTT